MGDVMVGLPLDSESRERRWERRGMTCSKRSTGMGSNQRPAAREHASPCGTRLNHSAFRLHLNQAFFDPIVGLILHPKTL